MRKESKHNATESHQTTREEREKKRTNKNKQGRENYKENTGTKLITNTKA